MSNIFKNISKFFIYFSLTAPLILVYSLFFPFITGKVVVFRTGVELALLFFLFYLVANLKHLSFETFKLLRHPIVIAVLIFTFVLLLTSLLGIKPAASFWSNFERGEGVFQILHYISFFLLVIFLFNTVEEWKRLLSFSLIISFLVTLYGLLQWFQNFGFHNFTISTGRTSGTLGNPSYLTAYLIFHFLFVIWIIFNTKKTLPKWLWAVLLIFEIWMFFTTRTLAAILGFLVAIILAIGFYIYKIYKTHANHPDSLNEKHQKLLFYASYLCSFVLIILVGGSIYYFSTINLYDRLKPRLWAWGSAASGIMERPILGWGLENFPEVFDKYYNANHFGGESWFDRTHNLFLEYLITGGILLLIAYLVIFICYYWRLFKLKKDWFWPILFVIPIAYFIQGLTLFDVLAVYIALFLFLAFFVHYSENFRSNALTNLQGKLSIEFWILSVVSTIFISLLLYFGTYLPLRKNMMLAEVLRKNNIIEVIESSEKLLDFYSPIGQQESYEAIGRNFVLFLGGATDKGGKIDPNNPMFLKIMKIGNEHFEEIRPRLIGVKDFYLNGLWNIAAYKATGQKDYLARAKSILDEGLSMAPNRMELLVGRLEVARREKDQKKELEILNKINSLRPDLAGRF